MPVMTATLLLALLLLFFHKSQTRISIQNNVIVADYNITENDIVVSDGDDILIIRDNPLPPVNAGDDARLTDADVRIDAGLFTADILWTPLSNIDYVNITGVWIARREGQHQGEFQFYFTPNTGRVTVGVLLRTPFSYARVQLVFRYVDGNVQSFQRYIY